MLFVGGMFLGVFFSLMGTSSNSAMFFILVATFMVMGSFFFFIRAFIKFFSKKTVDDDISVDNTLSGVFFGKRKGEIIKKSIDKDGNVLIIGGVGSGKSQCIAIPSLLTWEKRVFVIDIKGELYKNTKQKRPNIKVLDPLDPNSCGYDPFFVLKSKNVNLVQEIMSISQSLIPLTADVKEPFWIESAQNLLSGTMLFFYKEGYTFLQTITAIQSEPINELVILINEEGAEQAKLFINNFVSMDSKTLASVYATLSKNIITFTADETIFDCLSRENNITPYDLENNKDVYIILPDYLINQTKNFLALIVDQFLRHFEKRPDREGTPILFLLDEFARIGKMARILDALATLRSKKITICLIIQSFAQLELIYGKQSQKVICDTCQYQAILSITDVETQDYFSKRVGTYEEIKKSFSQQISLSRSGINAGLGANQTTNEKRRIKAEDFGTLSDIVLLTPYGYMRVDKVYYHKNKDMFK